MPGPPVLLAVRLGGLHVGTPVLLAVGGALCGLVSVAVLVLVAVFVVRRLRARGRPDAAARAAMLAGLGYDVSAPGRWIRPVPGLPLTFEDVDGGWRWTGRLPRYGTLHLEVAERRGEGLGALKDSFLTQDAELDERFVVRSDRPSQTLNLLADQEVGDLLLAMPFVHLELRGDELVFTDPDLEGLRKLCGAQVQPGSPGTLKHEARLHEDVMKLGRAIIAALPR